MDMRVRADEEKTTFYITEQFLEITAQPFTYFLNIIATSTGFKSGLKYAK